MLLVSPVAAAAAAAAGAELPGCHQPAGISLGGAAAGGDVPAAAGVQVHNAAAAAVRTQLAAVHAAGGDVSAAAGVHRFVPPPPQEQQEG